MQSKPPKWEHTFLFRGYGSSVASGEICCLQFLHWEGQPGWNYLRVAQSILSVILDFRSNGEGSSIRGSEPLHCQWANYNYNDTVFIQIDEFIVFYQSEMQLQ